MTPLMMVTIIMSTKNTNPVNLAMTILALSIMSTTLLFKYSMTSWVSFVTILTFSSGMMTLFMYTASLAPNEISKNKKKKLIATIMATTMLIPHTTSKSMPTMKSFSSKTLMMMMAAILILTIISISNNSSNPMQTLSNSF